MNRKSLLILIGVILFAIPVVGRMLWYYRGNYHPPDQIPVPSFSEITVPQAPVSETRRLPEEHLGQRSSVVLVDTAHANRFDVSELDTLSRALAARGASVELFDSNAEFDELGLEGRLKYADAYIVVSPFESYSAFEVDAIRRFVERNGRLLVILDPTRSSSDPLGFGFADGIGGGDVAVANQLLEPLDLSFSSDYLYNLEENEGNFRNVFFERFGESTLTENLNKLTMYAAQSVFTDTGTPLVFGGESVFSSITDADGGHSAAALSPGSNALALGDLSFLQPPYDNVTDNFQFIQNLADYLTAGERDRGLADLPFVFSGPVAVVQSGDFALQAETLFALQSVGGALQIAGIELTFPEKPHAEGDRLVLGLFDPDPDLEPHLASFDIVLPTDDPDGMLYVPGFGAVNPAGIGVIALAREDGSTTLALLAEDEERLVSLLESVSFELLEGCLVQGDYGLCKVGEGEGFDSTDEFEFDLDFEETFSD